MMMQQDSSAITSKVWGAALGGAISVFMSWIMKQFYQVEMTPEAAQAVTLIVTLVCAYLTPPSIKDSISPKEPE